jgi:hypothetical protein
MIWYLIFCSGVSGGPTCASPVAMPSKEACLFVGKEMLAMAERANSFPRGNNYKCVGVKKESK